MSRDGRQIKSTIRTRASVFLVSALSGAIALIAMDYLLPINAPLAAILLDKRVGGNFPVSIQSVTWIVFFLGLGTVIQRWLETRHEAAWLNVDLLPKDPSVVLERPDLGEIYRRSKNIPLHQGFLSQLVRRVIQQVQVSNSVELGTTVLNSSLDLFHHEIDLRYNIIRYIMWLIPTLGFIGTVIGIADALNFVGLIPSGEDIPMDELTAKLGVAFYTTLLSLLLAGLLVFTVHLAQGFEEATLNETGQYCLDNLINRIYLGQDKDPTG